ncbi:MAG: hypothetical protein B7X02_00895 [Rhodospirillales bacterium 12-54-5]|nr:MAG: hypothetical protein B7X02_00895 [Rhodospirillales bacterium 12-54-5]
MLLDETVVPLTFATNTIGNRWTMRAVTFGANVTTGSDVAFAVVGNSLKPFSPVRVKATKNISTNDVTFSWLRRTRVDGNLRDYVDIPLNEASELYDISVLNGSTVVRSWQTSIPTQLYTAAQQTADFGSLQSSYTVKSAILAVMNLLPHPLVSSEASTPVHTLLLNFGKGWRYRENREAVSESGLPANIESISATELLQYQNVKALERRVREMTVKQLTISLRMQSPESEDITMLNSLESLVLAGEIPYKEFVERVQNLFPHAMAGLESSLRMKVAALVL